MHELLTERVNLFEPNNYMSFYLEFTQTSLETLKEAITKAYFNHEVLLSKIVLESSGRAYYRYIGKCHSSIDVSNKSWEEILSIQEKRPFRLNEGEFIRSFILPLEHKTGLLLFAHHLVGDGQGMMVFIQDIFHALVGKELVYQPLSLLTKDSFPSSLPWVAKVYTSLCNLRWKIKGNKSYTWKDYEEIHHLYWSQYASKLKIKTFSQEETMRLKEVSKKMNVSLNSLITTSFVQIDDQKHSVGMITSLREKGNKSLANLISGISIDHTYDHRLSFEQNAKCIHQKVKRALKDYSYFVVSFISRFHPSLIDGVLLNTHGNEKSLLLNEIAHIMGYKGTLTRDIGITNLTVLDLPTQFENYTLDRVIVVAPCISYTRNVVCAFSFNQQLTLVYHDMKTNENKENLFFEKGLKSILNLLKNSDN